jgi:hypothetical protein
MMLRSGHPFATAAEAIPHMGGEEKPAVVLV